jgi:hypothetical protein
MISVEESAAQRTASAEVKTAEKRGTVFLFVVGCQLEFARV